MNMRCSARCDRDVSSCFPTAFSQDESATGAAAPKGRAAPSVKRAAKPKATGAAKAKVKPAPKPKEAAQSSTAGKRKNREDEAQTEEERAPMKRPAAIKKSEAREDEAQTEEERAPMKRPATIKKSEAEGKFLHDLLTHDKDQSYIMQVSLFILLFKVCLNVAIRVHYRYHVGLLMLQWRGGKWGKPFYYKNCNSWAIKNLETKKQALSVPGAAN